MSQVTYEVVGAEEAALRKVAERLDMTVQEVTQALGAGAKAALDQLIADREQYFEQRIQELSRLLTNERLLELAAKHPPPQEWFDSDDDPFSP